MIRTVYQAAGAIVAAAMFALAAAPAAQAELVDTDLTPDELLAMASATLTHANEVLGQVDLAGYEDSLLHQIHVQDDALRILDAQGTLQDPLLSGDNVTSQLLTYADQGFYQGSQAILTADQALDTTEPLTGAAAIEAFFGVFGADFQFLDASINAVFLDMAAYFTSALGF